MLRFRSLTLEMHGVKFAPISERHALRVLSLTQNGHSMNQETPREFLKRNPLPKPEQVAKQALAVENRANAAFCAFPGLDWNPFYRFPECQLFVYVDNSVEEEDFDRAFEQIGNATPLGSHLDVGDYFNSERAQR